MPTIVLVSPIKVAEPWLYSIIEELAAVPFLAAAVIVTVLLLILQPDFESISITLSEVMNRSLLRRTVE
jgi:hypothetical protein